MISLAVKYRPQNFEDVVGQTEIKEILQYQVDEQCNVNCYLFTGGAGTGKTTCARIFAKALNDNKGLPIEIDAASNNGVEQVRKIIDEAKFKSLDSKYKVYILDECHMLSSGAWNAMLKLLEEPPASTIFIMCTTDPQKIPATILSRVQRFDFQRIPHSKIVNRLQWILKQENITDYEKDSLEYIAKLANGGMRDSITLLDKCLAYTPTLTVNNVVTALGIVNYDTFIDLLEYCFNGNDEAIIKLVEDVHLSGKNLKLFMADFFNFLVDLYCYGVTKDLSLTRIPDCYRARLCTDFDYLQYVFEKSRQIKNLINNIKWQQNVKPFILVELMDNAL